MQNLLKKIYQVSTPKNLGIVITFISTIIFGYLIVVNKENIYDSISISQEAFALLVALQVTAFVLRTEIWRIALQASNITAPRYHLHIASALTFLTGSFIRYISATVRIAVLRLLEGNRQARFVEMLAADVTPVLLEALLASLILTISLILLKLPIWSAITLFLLSISLIIIVKQLNSSQSFKPFFVKGMSLISNHRLLAQTFLLIAFVFIMQITRVLISFQISGLEATFLIACLGFVVTGISGVLPLGILGTPAALTLVFGSAGLSKAAAAGLLLTSTLVVAAIIYCILSFVLLIIFNKKINGTFIYQGATH